MNYQAAMHATRAAVYHLPHLDSPALRRRKLQIFIDDDGLAGGDTHHYQLTRAFGSIGAKFLLDDEAFGEPAELCRHLEAETARFVRSASKLYARSLGPWCVIETLSVDWMRALAEALSVHFPEFGDQPYFAECFTNEVEERHAAEALAVTQSILDTRPQLIKPTLRDATTIARALDGVWRHLDRIVREAIGAAAPEVKRQSRCVDRLRAGSIDQHIRCGTITARSPAAAPPRGRRGNGRSHPHPAGARGGNPLGHAVEP